MLAAAVSSVACFAVLAAVAGSFAACSAVLAAFGGSSAACFAVLAAAAGSSVVLAAPLVAPLLPALLCWLLLAACSAVLRYISALHHGITY